MVCRESCSHQKSPYGISHFEKDIPYTKEKALIYRQKAQFLDGVNFRELFFCYIHT